MTPDLPPGDAFCRTAAGSAIKNKKRENVGVASLARLALSVSTSFGLAACQNFSGTYSNLKPSTDGPAILTDAGAAPGNAQNPANTADSSAQFNLPIPDIARPTAAQFGQLKDAAGTSWTTEEILEYQRNELVGKYLAESDGLCAEYLQDLTRTQRTYSLLLGSLSTIFGGAGAAFTSASVVRPLSALASISSGERAEFDADTFAKQTSQVIISAIKNSRARTYNTIVQVNFLKPINAWPVSVALADVQDYHSRCSLNEGITEAAASIIAVAPQSTPKTASAQEGVAGRSETPPSTTGTQAQATLAAVQGAAVASAATAGSSANQVANAVNGAITAANVAASGSTSPTAAIEAGAAAATIVPPATAAPVIAVGPTVNTSAAASVARAQLALSKKGSATVVVDGLFGSITISAIKQFQTTHVPPLPVTGIIDPATAAALGVASPAPIATPATNSAAAIRQTQALLKKLPLGAPISPSLTTTGVIDAPTIAALIVYQDSKGLPLTGVLDTATLADLGITP